MPPDQRQNPPFLETQINDARNDERGLLTTYDLFNLYFNIKDGILDKKEARKRLLDHRLVVFRPTLTSLGIVKELHHNNTVAILDLNGIKICKGQSLVFKKGHRYATAMIESIELDDKDVSHADTGELGIGLSERLPKDAELFLKDL
jgi:hypothetical protein